MAYTYSEAAREKTPLFKNITARQLNNIIREAASIIDRRLGGKYTIDPIRKRSGYYSTGTVSVSKDNNVLSGSGTLFKTDSGNTRALRQDDYLMLGLQEVVRVEEVQSETVAVLSHNANITLSGVDFFIIPSPLVLANQNLAASLVAAMQFSRQAYNQETTDYRAYYERMAKEQIDGLLVGNYLDVSLQPATQASGAGRIASIYESDSNDMAKDLIAEQNSPLFKC